MTADGSIDCLQKPDAQEEVTSLLHYCETITALQALSPGTFFLFFCNDIDIQYNTECCISRRHIHL